MQLLGKKQFTAFETGEDDYIIFTDVSVEVRSKQDRMSHPRGGRIIGLSNSGPEINQPSAAFLKSLACYVVQATSPVPARWYQWGKEYGVQETVMDAWSRSELEALALVIYSLTLES